jgi:hypothetical protein
MTGTALLLVVTFTGAVSAAAAAVAINKMAEKTNLNMMKTPFDIDKPRNHAVY